MSHNFLKFTFILTLLITSNPLIAQVNITGKIVNGQTNESVPFSKILLLSERDSTIVRYTNSDHNGDYRIENIEQGNYFIKATFIGYHDYHSPLHTILSTDQLISLDIKLYNEDSSTLMDGVVISTKRKLPLIEYKPDMIVLNVEDNIVTAGSNIWELLSKSPGIEASQNNLSILGTTSISVLINGRSTHLQGEQLSNMLKGMSADQVAQLEIINNPSAKYDAGNGTGVINIKLKKNQSDGLNSNTSFTYGQGRYDKYNPTFNLNYRANKFSMFANYSFLNIKDYRNAPSYVSYREMENPVLFEQKQFSKIKNNSNNLIVGLDYELNTNSNIGIQFTGQKIKISNQYENNTNILTNNILESIIKTSSNIVQPNTLQLYNFYYTNNINKLFSLTINADLGFYNTKNRQDYEFLYLNPDHTEKGPIEFYNNEVPSKINIKALSADITKKFDSELLLEAGAKSSLMENNSSINYQYRDTNGDFITDANTMNYFNYKEHINAAYISLHKKYSQFMVNAGLRIEYSIIEGNSLQEGIIADTDYTRLFPSLTAEYKFNDDHQLNFSYSTSFARPNYTYLSPLTVIRDPNAYSTGNPFLTPSYTNTLELTYTMKKKYRLALQIQDITDRIEQSVFQDYNSLTIENNIVNIDKNYYYRLYFIIPLNITKWWTNNLVLNNYIIQYKTPFLKGIYNKSKPVFYINSTSSFNLPNGIKGELLIYYRTPSLNGLYEVGERFFVDAGLKKTFSNNFSIGMSITDIFHTNKWVWDINYLDQHSGFKTITDSRIFKLNLSYKLGNNKVKTAKSNKSGIGNERQRL